MSLKDYLESKKKENEIRKREEEKIKNEMRKYRDELKKEAAKERIKIIRKRQTERLKQKYKNQAEWDAMSFGEKLSKIKKDAAPSLGYLSKIARQKTDDIKTSGGFGSLGNYGGVPSPEIRGNIPKAAISGKIPNSSFGRVSINDNKIPRLSINFGAIDKMVGSVSSNKEDKSKRYRLKKIKRIRRY